MGSWSSATVPADVVSANPVVVGQQWREAERERYAKGGDRCGKLIASVDAWLARYPEFATAGDGLPCPYAINTVLRLRSKHGAGGVTRRMAREGWLTFLSSRPDLDWYVAEMLPHLKTSEVTP